MWWIQDGSGKFRECFHHLHPPRRIGEKLFCHPFEVVEIPRLHRLAEEPMANKNLQGCPRLLGGASPRSGLHASYSASTLNRALVFSLSVLYNVLGEGGTGQSVSPGTPPITIGLAGRNSGDTGGGSECRAFGLFNMWKLPSSN
jgi:hypothetical protein